MPERFRLRILGIECIPFLDDALLLRCTSIGDCALAETSTGGSPKPAEMCVVVIFKQISVRYQHAKIFSRAS